MQVSEFQGARAQRIKAFDLNYATLKKQYQDALKVAIAEQDRASQCQKIKEVLDINKRMTQLVQEVLVGSDDPKCKLSPERIHQLRADIEMYKQQQADIQQGKDRVYALQQALDREEERVNIVKGSQLIYVALLAVLLLVLVVVVVRSSLSRMLNTQAVSQVVTGGFA